MALVECSVNIRHSYCSRFLYTVVPSEMYAVSTLDTLLEGLADDLEKLCTEGLEVVCLYSIYYAEFRIKSI